MRFVIALFALLFASLPFGGEANASAEGKRVMLLGTANLQHKWWVDYWVLHRRLGCFWRLHDYCNQQQRCNCHGSFHC